MAIIWGLALIDLIAAVFLIALHFDVLPPKFIVPFAVYLIAKGIGFREIASYGDMIIGIYMLIMVVFDFESLFVWIAAFWLSEKAIFSFLAH